VGNTTGSGGSRSTEYQNRTNFQVINNRVQYLHHPKFVVICMMSTERGGDFFGTHLECSAVCCRDRQMVEPPKDLNECA
jgi:hypothetical protein